MPVETFPGAGITARHSRYLPSGPPGDKDELLCASPCPSPRFLCTRDAGHEGDHAAHGIRPLKAPRQFARWPQEAA